jgi:hypothetical protein
MSIKYRVYRRGKQIANTVFWPESEIVVANGFDDAARISIGLRPLTSDETTVVVLNIEDEDNGAQVFHVEQSLKLTTV